MATTGYGWLGPALRWQASLATVLTTGFCALAMAGVTFRPGMQLAILLAGIVVVGFPHGAFDHLIARPRLAPHLGQHWWAPFLAAYLGLAGLVGLAWATTPAATLAAFLAASVVHFGLGDVAEGLAPSSVPRLVSMLTFGALPILLPAALHPDQAAPVLAALAEVGVPAMLAQLHRAAWLLPAWALAFACVLVAQRHEPRLVAERLATAAGFVLLPPLLAFGLYFGAGHSVRHVLRLGAWHAPADPRAAGRWLAWVIVPAGLVCAASLGMMALLGQDTTRDLLAPAFRIIAALTLPHMIVTAWLERADRL